MPTRLLLLALLAAAPAAARAQPGPGGPPGGFAFPEPPPAPTLSYEGTEVFRWMLQRAEIRPIDDAELIRLARNWNADFSDTIVIVFGDLNRAGPVNQQPRFWIDTAYRNGGAVLFAHDNFADLTLSGFDNPVPLRVQMRRLLALPDPDRFARNDDAPFAEPIITRGRTAPEWKLFAGDRPLGRVATADPRTILLPPNAGRTFTTIARFPAGTEFADNNAELGVNDVFAVARSGPHPTNNRPHRFLAVADPDVFSNGLLVSQDINGATDNLDFAERVVTFLSEENGEKRRTKCVFIHHGQLVTNFDELSRLLRPPLPPLPRIPWDQIKEKLQPKLVDLGNQILDKVQENDLPNKLLVGSNPDAPNSRLRYLLAALAVMAAVWAVVALVRRVWGARTPTDLTPAPPGGRPPPPPDGRAGVFGRRGKELAARDNLLEPARAACRDFFDAVGTPPDPGPRLPKVVISDVVRRPETLRQALRDLWAVAYGRPAPVSAMRWAALEPLIARAGAAHRDGKWRFVESDAWARPRGEA